VGELLRRIPDATWYRGMELCYAFIIGWLACGIFVEASKALSP